MVFSACSYPSGVTKTIVLSELYQEVSRSTACVHGGVNDSVMCVSVSQEWRETESL